MENQKMYDIVIIGNYTKDTIVSAAGTRYVDGGGFNYGAHVAALMDLNAVAVTRLAAEDKHVVDQLKNIGLDVFATYTPQSTFMRLEYPTSNVDERILTVSQNAGAFTPEQVKDLSSKSFLINASARGEVGVDVLSILKEKNAIIAADVQGYVRVIQENGVLAYQDWPEKEEILPYFDILKTDAVEAEALVGERDFHAAAEKIAQFGPREVVLTHRNGMLVYAGGKYYEAKFLPDKLVGRSGRGDTCIGTYVGKRLSASPEEATIWAAAITSLKLEAEGPINRKKSDVLEIINKKYQ